MHVQTNAFVDAALQQFIHGDHQAVHLHGFGVQRLTAGKRQQAVSQARRAVGRSHPQVDQAVQVFGSPPGQASTQQFQAADDAGQHVVEIMGDAAGELADGFHFLQLAQRFFVVAQLLGALFHLLLKGLESVLQAQLALAQVNQAIPGFVLSSTPAQGGGDQTDQCDRVKRPFEEGDVAQLRAEA
ncbi:hypothetical protein D3C86_1544040 [compost metagenome]